MPPLLAIGSEPLSLDRLIAAVTARPATRRDRTGLSSRSWGWCATATWGAAFFFSSTKRTICSRSRPSSESPPRWSGGGRASGWPCIIGPVGSDIGDASVAIAAASPHRADAYAACRYTIERVKQIAPVWKREFFDGGDVWIEGATADPTDEAARVEAERTACA